MVFWKGKLTVVGRLRPPFSATKTVPVVTPAVPPINKRVNSDVSVQKTHTLKIQGGGGHLQHTNYLIQARN